MATKRNPAEQFTATVADALKHYNDPLWLSQHSPLATPYFLGYQLPKEPQAESRLGRGRALQRIIFQAAASIWPGELPQSQQGLLKLVERERAEEICGPRYLFLLLDLRYLRRYFLPSSPPNTVGAMYDLLNVSETRFFAHLQLARNRLAMALLRVTRPSLRLERPLAPALIGRKQLLQQCSTDLALGRSVTLSGVAGVGKTSLGAHLAQHWPSDATFWHTFRPGLNDDLTGVVFGLAHFLHQHGCSSLWLQLMAKEGELGATEEAIGFLREDLSCAGKLPALLCFDEVDLLHTKTTQPRHGVHKQVLELLEGLRRLTPLLLIGQRGLIDTEAFYSLAPLTLAETEEFLGQANVMVTRGADSIHRITGGNPRFLELYVALRKSVPNNEEPDLGRSPSIRPLFNRLWKRLETNEKQVLMGLSVFRSYAPVDAWKRNAGLDELRGRDLLKADVQGGVALLPLFRELVYAELSPQQRQEFHQQGANIRAQRGQYTEAAYHFVQAGQYELAVNVWYHNQNIEIEQGKAGAAYILFQDANSTGLSDPVAKRLKVVQDRLSLLHGDSASVLANIDSYSWHLEEKITADALEQWGQAHLIRGDIDGALADFDNAISALGEVSTQIARLHRRRGQMYIEQAALDLAERETQLAQFEVEHLRALIEMAQGRFLKALDYLKSARRVAESASDTRRTARTDELLAIAAGNYGDFTLARYHAQLAMSYYERIGDRLRLENLRAEMAGTYLNARKFVEAIEPLEQALRFFEGIKHDLRIGFICSNLAEAYYETRQLELAERFALRAIQSENPRVQPYACYTLGYVRYAQHRLAESEHVFQTGINAAQQTGDMSISAYLYRAYGEILCKEASHERGIERLRTALDLFTRLTMIAEVKSTDRLIEACTSREL